MKNLSNCCPDSAAVLPRLPHAPQRPEPAAAAGELPPLPSSAAASQQPHPPAFLHVDVGQLPPAAAAAAAPQPGPQVAVVRHL